MIELGKVQ